LIVSTWPELKSFDANLISDFESTWSDFWNQNHS
jgi:hypothetical protein